MEFKLRPYQEAGVAAGVRYLRDPKLRGHHDDPVVPTGSGKSLLIAEIVQRLGASCIVFQPSKEILVQNAGKLAHYGHKASVYSASLNRREIGRVTLATIGSAVKHPDYFTGFKYVLIDECHLVNLKQGMYRDFLATMKGARFLGLTATPYRLASNSYGTQLRFLTRTRPRIFVDMVHQTQIGDLFEHRWLSPIRWEEKMALDPSGLKINSTGGGRPALVAPWSGRCAGFSTRESAASSSSPASPAKRSTSPEQSGVKPPW